MFKRKRKRRGKGRRKRKGDVSALNAGGIVGVEEEEYEGRYLAYPGLWFEMAWAWGF